MASKLYLISGTPGTGKTSVAKKLNKKYCYKILSIGDIVIKNSLYSAEDEKRDTKIVDTDKFNKYFEKLFNKQKDEELILEGHYSDLIKYPVKLAIILRCHPKKIEERLKSRNYKKKKIIENIQAELLGDCTSYFFKKKKLVKNNSIFEIDTTDKTIEEVADIIQSLIIGSGKIKKYVAGQLSWLSDESVSIEKYLD